MHAAVDAKGLPIRLLLSGGNQNDFVSAPLLIEAMDLSGCSVLADKGYDSAQFVSQIEVAGGIAVIPSRHWNRTQRNYDKEVYKCRNQVERFFNRMKQFRRFATRYEKTAKSFLALIHFVAVFVTLAILKL